MQFLFKIANSIRRIYWYIFRPRTKGVKCLIEHDGEYLLIQTSYSGRYWTLPGGGVGRNEDPETAAIREVNEEFEIKIVSIKKIGQYESTVEYKRDTVYLFHAQVSSKDFHPSNVEVSDAKWFSKSDLPENRSRALNESILIDLIRNDSWRMQVLRSARSLNLSDWLIGAGFVRNLVWDHLHGYIQPTQATDIDVAYFDKDDLSEGIEVQYQDRLHHILNADWSVTNQARMASINHQSKQYISTVDAIAHWPETATCIGVRLENNDTITVIAPYGLSDLFSLTVKMSPKFGDGIEDYKKRIAKKKWIEKWPKLHFVSQNETE